MSRLVTAPDPNAFTLPNVLSGLRLLSAPILLLLAVAGQPEAFLGLLAAGFLTDAVDGVLARSRGQTSRLGARLDSAADVAVYTATAIALWLLWPELVRSEWLAVAAVVISVALPAVAGLLRFGRLTSYHTRLVKVAVAATAIGLFLMLLGLSVWPFRLAALLAVLAALEEVAITLVLREERSDVASLWQVLGQQRSASAGGEQTHRGKQ
jgi:CDP-diacylglycerol--glycerol-3-phosphate 3-phosphatidyltransferase